MNKPPERDGLPAVWQLFVFLAAGAVIVSRRPDAILHARFYAEDGAIWFADAYNRGWYKALFWPNSGYIQLLPRLAGSLALLAPLLYAPLVENVLAILIQALPASLLLSAGSRSWGSLRFRAVLAGLYLLLPNTSEMIGTVTEAQWFLALSVLIIVSGFPPKSMVSRTLLLMLVALCAFTGPFCVFLFPISLFYLKQRRRDRWAQSLSLVLLLGVAIQAVSLVTHLSSRPSTHLGATGRNLIRILSMRVYLSTLIGANGRSMHFSYAELAWIAGIGSLLLLLFAWAATAEIRSLVLLALLILGFALARPVVFPPPGMTAWEVLAQTAGLHYWFFPSLAIAWSIASCALRGTLAFRGRSFLRIVAACLLAALAVGIQRDYRYPPPPDLHFAAYVRRMESAPRGVVVAIPEYPPGWYARLTKH